MPSSISLWQMAAQEHDSHQFRKAAANGDLQTVQTTLRQGPPPDWQHALHAAAFGGHLGVVQELLRSRASIDSQGGIALHRAAETGHLSIVQELIKSRATTDLQDKSGRTAADVAKDAGHTDVVQLLEDAVVTRALQVFGAMESTTIVVRCTTLAGEEAARFSLDPDAKLSSLFDMVQAELPLPVGAWTLILPTGETLDEAQSDVDLMLLFGLQVDD